MGFRQWSSTAEQTLSRVSIILNVISISIEYWRAHQKASGPQSYPRSRSLQFASVWLINPVEGQARATRHILATVMAS